MDLEKRQAIHDEICKIVKKHASISFDGSHYSDYVIDLDVHIVSNDDEIQIISGQGILLKEHLCILFYDISKYLDEIKLDCYVCVADLTNGRNIYQNKGVAINE